MKQKFNIRWDNPDDAKHPLLKEVEGEWLPETYGLKAFIHKDEKNHWTITEYYTGMSLCGGFSTNNLYKKKDIIEDFMQRARNIDYWKTEEKRTEFNKKIVQDILKTYGYANCHDTERDE